MKEVDSGKMRHRQQFLKRRDRVLYQEHAAASYVTDSRPENKTKCNRVQDEIKPR